MRKALLALAAFLLIAGQASAASTLWNVSDQPVEDEFTSEAFAASSLGNFTSEAALDTGESLEAVIRGYNSTAETANQSFELVDGNNEKEVTQSFSENTSTFVVDFNASNGTVTILDAEITGTESNESISGAAPSKGGFLTGLFSFDISESITAIGNYLSGLLEALIPW